MKTKRQKTVEVEKLIQAINRKLRIKQKNNTITKRNMKSKLAYIKTKCKKAGISYDYVIDILQLNG